MLKTYQVTYRIHNGYQYNSRSYYETTTETIEAASKQEAYEKAYERASTPSLIAHDPVTVSKRDVKLVPAPKLKTFNVTLYFHTSGTVTIKAKDEKEALVNAYIEAGKKKYDSMFLHNLTEDAKPDVEEVSDEEP